jgi:hypothetical protein
MIALDSELQTLAERLLQLANDEGTAQIHDVGLAIMRIATEALRNHVGNTGETKT